MENGKIDEIVLWKTYIHLIIYEGRIIDVQKLMSIDAHNSMEPKTINQLVDGKFLQYRIQYFS